jgi:nucleoside-diphosphate-sugar epimerase
VAVSPRPRIAAITGASGYLGGVIRSALGGQGWRTIALVRSPAAYDRDAIPFALGRPLDPAILEGVDVLIHCAYDLQLTSRRAIWRVNVAGTERLLDTALRAAVGRCIVISSTAAYEGTKQLYGQAKLATEGIATARKAVVVRPGLVYGPHAGGMVGSLSRAVSSPVVPLLAGRSHLYTLHQDDLTTGIVTVATMSDPPTTPFVLAHPDPVLVADLVRALAGARGTHPRFVPVPWFPVYWALRLAEKTPVTLPFRADSLWGLAHPTPGPDPEVLAAIGLTPRPFSEEDLAEPGR